MKVLADLCAVKGSGGLIRFTQNSVSNGKFATESTGRLRPVLHFAQATGLLIIETKKMHGYLIIVQRNI